jgi:predicted nucleic acid-binding protein
MKRTVYIETTVPSFFVETRSEPAMIARRESMRRWWEVEASRYELFASELVVSELGGGDYPGKSEALELVAGLPLLDVVSGIDDIVSVYLRRRLMPQKDVRDAYHLAIASHYAVNFLLTWNCRHLANVNKMEHLRQVNNDLGLYVPIVTTPDLLLREEADDVEG